MEPSDPSGRGNPLLPPQPQPSPTKKEVQLLGPRPSALRVTRESHAIRKPPRHPAPHAAGSSAAPPALPPPVDRQQPTIIFDISPKVIHVEERNFMSIVQQLTGSSSGDVSPAARLASIERTSPTGREKGFAGVAAAAEMGGSSGRVGDDDLMGMLGEFETRQIQGILSPAPGAIPAIPAGFFSPATDPHLLQDLSPFGHGNHGYKSPSSSTLFTALSPSPTASIDLSSQIVISDCQKLGRTPWVGMCCKDYRDNFLPQIISDTNTSTSDRMCEHDDGDEDDDMPEIVDPVIGVQEDEEAILLNEDEEYEKAKEEARNDTNLKLS